MILVNLVNRMVLVIIEILGNLVVLVNRINRVILVNLAVLSNLVIVLDFVILKKLVILVNSMIPGLFWQ